MRKTTVYSFAKRLMDDKEFNRGGLIENEEKYLDSIGFNMNEAEDLDKFYEAMVTLCRLQKKYSK